MYPAIRVSLLAAVVCVGLSRTVVAAPASCVDIRRTGSMIVRDMHGLLTAELLPLGVGLAATALVHPLDDNVDRWVSARPPSHLTRAGALAGGWQVQGPLIGGLLLDSLVERCVRPITDDLLRALALNEGVTYAIKASVRRERPDHEASHVSFPSGHASSTFALATVVQEHLGWRAGIPAYGLATYTAWTRVRDHKHWVSDTVFGGALGIAVGRAVVRTGREPRWSIAPSVGLTGASVLVSRVG
jgi:hypothetical protein